MFKNGTALIECLIRIILLARISCSLLMDPLLSEEKFHVGV